jgi:mycothiol system anti-sigma-R factor
MSEAPDRLTCEEMFRRLDDYLDRELSPVELARVESHLANCARCAGEYEFDATVLDRIRASVARVQAPPSLLERIRRELEKPDSERN